MTAPPTGTGLGRRLAANAVSAAAGRLIVLLMWLVLTPPLLRALGTDAFGVWSLFYALSFWLLALDLGLSQIAMRYVAVARATDRPGDGGEYATLAVMGYLLFGLIWLGLSPWVAGACVDWLRVPPPVVPAARWAFVAGALVLIFAGIVQTLIGVLQAHDRYDLAAWSLTLTALFQGAGVLVGLRTGAGLAFMVSAVVTGWALGAAVSLVLLSRGAREFSWSTPLRAARRWRAVLEFGGPVQLSNGFAVTHQQVDKALLARMVALAAVAPYELGMRVASAAASFPQFIIIAIHPTAAALHARADFTGLSALYLRSTRWVLVASTLLCAALVAAAAPLFVAWLGAPTPEAALALQGIALATFAASPAGTTSTFSRACGRPMLELEWSGCALAIHLLIGLLAIPVFGLRGALSALVAANLIASVWFVLRLGRVLRLPSGRILVDAFGIPLVALAAGILAGIALERSLMSAAFRLPWIVTGGVAGVAVAASALVLQVTGFVDWREAKALLSGPRRA